jgi:hypothetical protein
MWMCERKLEPPPPVDDNAGGNGVCRPAWENRLTVSALMTPTNKPTFAGAL